MQFLCYNLTKKIYTTYFQLFVVVFILLVIIDFPPLGSLSIISEQHYTRVGSSNFVGFVSAFSRYPLIHISDRRRRDRAIITPIQRTISDNKLSPTLYCATKRNSIDNSDIDTPSQQQQQQADPLKTDMASPQRLLEVFEDNSTTTATTTNNGCCETKASSTPKSPTETNIRRPMTMLTPNKMQKDSTPKRKGYLGWDDYFLGVAVLSSHRSKDPEHAEGACIADAENRIVAIGYSGFPRGCPDTIFPWNDYNKEDSDNDNKDETQQQQQQQWLHSKRPYVCDAATNAVLNKGSQDLAGCRLYVTKHPTSDCVKVMIQSGIRELIILQKKGEKNTIYNMTNMIDDDINQLMSNATEENEDIIASHFMLSKANIHFGYYLPPIPSRTLDFGCTDDVKRPTIVDGSCSSSSTIIMTDDEREAANILKEETKYDAFLINNNGRRDDYLSWDDYFMSVALLTAQRSKDPNTLVGACIVDDGRRIVGLGYNGMPRGLDDDDMPWARANTNQLFNKYKYVTHAEVNAILNSKGSYSSHVNGGTLYVTLFPCENCAKMIIQSGIKKIVYLKDVYHHTDGTCASRVMLRCAKVELQQYIPTMSTMIVKYYDQES